MKADAVEAQDGAVGSDNFGDNVIAKRGEIVVLSSEHLAYDKRAGRRWLLCGSLQA